METTGVLLVNVGSLSWVLLGWGALAAVLALNALRPVDSPFLRPFSFLAQLLIAECAQ